MVAWLPFVWHVAPFESSKSSSWRVPTTILFVSPIRSKFWKSGEVSCRQELKDVTATVMSLCFLTGSHGYLLLLLYFLIYFCICWAQLSASHFGLWWPLEGGAETHVKLIWAQKRHDFIIALNLIMAKYEGRRQCFICLFWFCLCGAALPTRETWDKPVL